MIMRPFRKNSYASFKEFLYYRLTAAAVVLALCVTSSGPLYGQAKGKPKKAASTKAPAKTQAKSTAKAPVKKVSKPSTKTPAKTPAKTSVKPPTKVVPRKITASVYYNELEPRQLFQILSGTFQVQFEGVEAVTGPVTLISKEKVDTKGMLQLLNEVLAKQNKAAEQKGVGENY